MYDGTPVLKDAASTAASSRFAVLDDDPTGVQTLAGVQVLLEWNSSRIASVLRNNQSVHLLTNSRAYPPGQARALVASAAAAARDASPDNLPILRGDSTLRGHVLEEYLAVIGVYGWPRSTPLVLAPSLPSAGRLTIGGIQYVQRNGTRLPVHTTEYASDGVFAYSNSRLLAWAEERTSGRFAAQSGLEVHVEQLRTRGAQAVVDAIDAALARTEPIAVVLDSENADDIEIAVAGLRQAHGADRAFVVRCGPAVAGAIAGATAKTLINVPSERGVLVACGSYVPQSARQLAALAQRYPHCIVRVQPEALRLGVAGLSKIVERLENLLRKERLAVLTVDGSPPPASNNLAAGLEVAMGLASVIAEVGDKSALVILKGGVTSAIGLRYGLEAEAAEVVGPVLPGVALWHIREPFERSCLVVPGNVGEDRLLTDLVGSALAEA